MSGFGSAPYGRGPYGSVYQAPSDPVVIHLVSSRRFDAAGHVVQRSDGSGDADGMSDNVQRALLLMARDVPDSDTITADFAQQREADIRAALRPLTEDERSLALDEVVAEDNGANSTATTARLRDLKPGTTSSVELKR